MPTTITLKNIPDDVYDRLRESAAMNKRSLNNEAIVCLESALMPGHLAPAARLERIRALRNSLPKGKFKASEIETLKRAGRK